MKYRKKPVEIEAIQYNGENLQEVIKFTEGKMYMQLDGKVLIDTLEGPHIVSFNDFIIRGIKGEYYPCKPDIFEATYEKVD